MGVARWYNISLCGQYHCPAWWVSSPMATIVIGLNKGFTIKILEIKKEFVLLNFGKLKFGIPSKFGILTFIHPKFGIVKIGILKFRSEFPNLKYQFHRFYAASLIVFSFVYFIQFHIFYTAS